MSQLTIEMIAEELNRRSKGFRIGNLQDLRVELKGLAHAPSDTIFKFTTATPSRDWACHFGGRKELQFNIGSETIDGIDFLRHGVAFSLEPSQSVRLDELMEILPPKIMLFNEFIREYQERLPDFLMWHWDTSGKQRSPIHQPCEITSELIQKDFFIFLGALQPRDDFDYERILVDFDRLLPLYKFVESAGNIAAYRDSPAVFQFRAGNNPKPSLSKALVAKVKSLSIALRHNDLQKALFDELCEEHGQNHVGTEIANGCGGRIDVVVQGENGYIYFEIKVGQSLQSCIRNAVGQLLEYSFWPGSQSAASLVVVGERPLDDEGRRYLETLQKELSIPIAYRQVLLETSPHIRR
jgi:hypothetical protein